MARGFLSGVAGPIRPENDQGELARIILGYQNAAEESKRTKAYLEQNAASVDATRANTAQTLQATSQQSLLNKEYNDKAWLRSNRDSLGLEADQLRVNEGKINLDRAGQELLEWQGQAGGRAIDMGLKRQQAKVSLENAMAATDAHRADAAESMVKLQQLQQLNDPSTAPGFRKLMMEGSQLVKANPWIVPAYKSGPEGRQQVEQIASQMGVPSQFVGTIINGVEFEQRQEFEQKAALQRRTDADNLDEQIGMDVASGNTPGAYYKARMKAVKMAGNSAFAQDPRTNATTLNEAMISAMTQDILRSYGVQASIAQGRPMDLRSFGNGQRVDPAAQRPMSPRPPAAAPLQQAPAAPAPQPAAMAPPSPAAAPPAQAPAPSPAPAPAQAGALPVMQTSAQAMSLPPGTIFQTPDGRTLVRP